MGGQFKFEAIVAKRLAAVETSPKRSNQHEFNGSSLLKDLFGLNFTRLESVPFYYVGDEKWLSDNGRLTWYDSREKNPLRTEHRLYYSTNEVTQESKAGDLLVLLKKDASTYIVIIAEGGSDTERKLIELFQLSLVDARKTFTLGELGNSPSLPLHFLFESIYDSSSVPALPATPLPRLEEIVKRFGTRFPPTRKFSEFARTFSNLKPGGSIDVDDVLLDWLNLEEHIFLLLESHLVNQKLNEGFADVADFISYSLSVQNRRKSRAGFSLENHLEEIFFSLDICFSRNSITENRSKPDFLFPGIKEYHSYEFAPENLFMLAVKTSCKDRWRQVLSEASKIHLKHLITLEPAISDNQLQEMKSHNVQLVVPKDIQKTYSPAGQNQIISLENFIQLIY